LTANGALGLNGALAVSLVTTAPDGAIDNVTHRAMVVPPVKALVTKPKTASPNIAQVRIKHFLFKFHGKYSLLY
jgi:hypothetical protein